MKQPSRLFWVRAYRFCFALLVFLAVIAQGRMSIFVNHNSPANYFSYFTIQSNLYAAAVLLWGALRPPGGGPTPKRDLARGAAVLYLTITGIVFALLLAGLPEAKQGVIPWTNTVMHQLLPLVLLADWLYDPTAGRPGLRGVIVWLAYPLIYLAYSLLRGALTGWYPYPFFEPTQPGGYASVAAYSLGISLGTLVLATLIAWLGSWMRRLRQRAAGPLTAPGQSAGSRRR